MNKKMLAVLAIVIAVAAGAFVMKEKGLGPFASPREILGAEAALPKFADDADHVLLKVENVEGLRRGVQVVKGFMSLISDPEMVDEMRGHYENLEEFGGVDPMDSLEQIDLAMRYVTLLDAFFTAADEIALLGTSPDVCMAFFTNEERYAAMKAAFVSADNAPEPWTTELADEGGEALLIRGTLPLPDGERDVALHILKRADGDRTQVLVANSEATMARAAGAWESEADRAVITRGTEGPNFLRYRISLPAFADMASRDLAAEMAWQREGNTTKLETFSDLGTTPATSGMEARPLPLFGGGEPFIITAFDLPYFFSLAMPGAENPVESFVSLMEMSAGQLIPGDFRDDVISALSGSRATIGVFMNSFDVVPETAYLALEMKSPDVLSKYYALAGMLMRSTQVEGWESVLSQNVDAEKGIDVTLARSGDLLLLGMGRPEAFGTRAAYPAAMAGMPETGVLVASYVTPKFLMDESTTFGAMVHELLTMDEDGRTMLEVLDMLNLGAIESIASVQADPKRGESRIVWRAEEQKPEAAQE